MTVIRSYKSPVRSKSSFTKDSSVIESKRKSRRKNILTVRPEPPTIEEIERLNLMASQPPFSFIFKIKDVDDPR
ncbi:MAG TPA: hypothetical protein VIL90_01370 [Puia sp.]